ncbi:MAG: 50S ribosomal protein L29 [Anaerolineae bacterium]
MDIREIRQMSDEAILDALEDKKEELYRFRLQKASGQLENLNSIGNARRIVARLKTVQRERQLAAAHTQGNKE